jgi:hypothetical protein
MLPGNFLQLIIYPILNLAVISVFFGKYFFATPVAYIGLSGRVACVPSEYFTLFYSEYLRVSHEMENLSVGKR